MTNKFILEAEEKENGMWEGSIEVESDLGTSKISNEYETLNRLMSDLQTKAVFHLAEMKTNETLRPNDRE